MSLTIVFTLNTVPPTPSREFVSLTWDGGVGVDFKKSSIQFLGFCIVKIKATNQEINVPNSGILINGGEGI